MLRLAQTLRSRCSRVRVCAHAFLAYIREQPRALDQHVGPRQRLVADVYACRRVGIVPDRRPVALLQARFDRIAVELEIAVTHAAGGEQLLRLQPAPRRAPGRPGVKRATMLSSIGPQYDMPVSRPSCSASFASCSAWAGSSADHRRCNDAQAFRLEAARAELLGELHRLPRTSAAVVEAAPA